MSTPSDEEKLGEKRYATLIVRLVLDQRGYVIYGELIEATSPFRMPFIERRGLMRLLRAWFASQVLPPTPDIP